MRRALVVLTLATGAAAALATVGTASASTPVTFTVQGGLLSISEPTTTASLGTLNASSSSSTISGSIGVTTVTDNRAVALGWTTTIQGPSGGFTNPATGATAIPAANAIVWVPSSTFTGTPALTTLRTDTNTTAAASVTLSATAPVNLVKVTAVGTNSATFNPSIQITVPGNSTAGVYTGTVTQTVS